MYNVVPKKLSIDILSKYLMSEMSLPSQIKIWIDIKNSHEPLFFKSLMNDLPYNFYITSRDFIEVVDLLNKYNIKHKVIGRYHAKNKFSKAIYLVFRSMDLVLKVPNYDFFLSHGSLYGMIASKIRGKPSITFSDNDLFNKMAKLVYEISTYMIVPKFLNYDQFKVNNLRLYNGFKEDIYIADFKPQECVKEIPFESRDYVLIRPESYKAYYVSMHKSIVGELIKLLKKENINIVLAPRYPEEHRKYRKIDGIYVLSKPVNGLCAAWNSKAVLTGAGTWAREAACMGVPAVSFFPGEKLLSVDAELIKRGWLYHSRDPEEIVEYVLSAKRNQRSLERSKKVKREVIRIIREIVEEGI